jgi:hypothetical protein
VFVRLAAGPTKAGRLLAIANSIFNLSAALAFVAFPPLATVVGEGDGEMVPLLASTAIALLSFMAALPLRGQLGWQGAKGGADAEAAAAAAAEAGAAAAAAAEVGGETVDDKKRGPAPRRGFVARWARVVLGMLMDTAGTVQDPWGLRLLYMVMALFYGPAAAFQSFAVPFLVEARGLSTQHAAAAASVFSFGPVVLSPLAGRLADWDLHQPALQSQREEQQRRQQQRRCHSGMRRRRPPPGSLQLAASALGAAGLLLPLLLPASWPLGFLLVSAGTATAGVAYWLSLALFVSPCTVGRVVGIALALCQAMGLVSNVTVGALVDRAADDYRKGALPFLFALTTVGLGASVLVLPRFGRAVAKGEEGGEGNETNKMIR